MEGCMFRFEHIRSYKAKVANKETQDKRRKADDLVNFGKVPSKIGHVDCLDDDGFPYGCQIELHLLYKCGRAGFSKSGTKRVYNGRNGEMVRSLIFMGPTFTWLKKKRNLATLGLSTAGCREELWLSYC